MKTKIVWAMALLIGIAALPGAASAQYYDSYGRPIYPPPPYWGGGGYAGPPPPPYYGGGGYNRPPPPPYGYWPPPGYGRPPPPPGYGYGYAMGPHGPRPPGTSRVCATSRGSCDVGSWQPISAPCRCMIPGFGRKRGNIS
jgi:hypothetical protein